jgi:hypothetical protein
MKFSSPTNDLQLWFCTLIFKEDYARIRFHAECELQLEVIFNPKMNWNLGQMEASRSNIHFPSKSMLDVKNFKKLRFCKQWNKAKQMTNITQNSSIASMDRKSVSEFVVYKESCFCNKQLFFYKNLVFQVCC